MKRPASQVILNEGVADAAWRAADTMAASLENIADGPGTAEERLRRCVETLGGSGALEMIAPRTSAFSSTALLVARERLGWSAPLADLAFAMQGLGSYPIFSRGSEPLREEFLGNVRSGTWIAAIGLTETGAGSDLANVQTTYEQRGDHFEIVGEKVFISNAPEADFYCVLARSGDSSRKRPFSMFAVRANVAGVSASSTPVLGDHPIGTVSLNKVRVPLSALIANEGDGMGIALGTLHRFRASVGAASLGFAQRAFDETVRHVKTRHQFGAPLADLQAVQLRIADMKTRLEAARLLVYRCASVFDSGDPQPSRERRAAEAQAGSMAKLVATEHASAIIDDAVQLHGGRGVERGSTVGRLYNEVRALRIYEGASDVQRLLIARRCLEEAE